jgi:hypothetical protein
VISESEVGLDAVLEGDQPELLESSDRSLCERLVAEVGQRRATP